MQSNKVGIKQKKNVEREKHGNNKKKIKLLNSTNNKKKKNYCSKRENEITFIYIRR